MIISFFLSIWGFLKNITAKQILYVVVAIGFIVLGFTLHTCERDKLIHKVNEQSNIIDLKDQTIKVARNNRGQTVYHSSTIEVDINSLKEVVKSLPEFKALLESDKIKARKIDALVYQVSNLDFKSKGIHWKDSMINDTTHVKIARITDPAITPYIEMEVEEIGDMIIPSIEIKDTTSNIILWKRKKRLKWLFGGIGIGAKEYELQSVHSNPYIRNTVQKSLIVKHK